MGVYFDCVQNGYVEMDDGLVIDVLRQGKISEHEIQTIT